MSTELQVWQWTLTKEAVAPCFVRDVLEMRQSTNADFFWLGHTPCRTVLLVGLVVAVQVYDKRAIYTIDDGTAVVDCVFRYPPPPPVTSKSVDTSTKKARLRNATLESMEPPPPITEPGYPVRVVGKVVRYYQSKQIHTDSIDPCPSSLDEIAHLERVVELHKTKYSLAVQFQVPPKASSSHSTSTPSVETDASVISTFQGHTHVPSSPTAPSIASSTPSSPCKSSGPVKQHETSNKARLRHPSRLHTRDLTANTFRLYVKHYMDNAPPSPMRSTCGGFKTPTKHARDEDESDMPTPRPGIRTGAGEVRINNDEVRPTLGFTLSHLRRVPELALLAARVVRAETRKRDKAEREKEKERANSRIAPGGTDQNRKGSTVAGTTTATDSPRKKIKRLLSWAVVKLYEEGAIVLWDGDVRPLPVPPLDPAGPTPSIGLYTASASASLYSDYHAPRRQGKAASARGREDKGDVDAVDPDADPAYLSDPPFDEESYIPLTARFLAGYARDAMNTLRRGRGRVHATRGAGVNGGTRAPTAEDVLAHMQRVDARWAKVGVWAVEEALAMGG